MNPDRNVLEAVETSLRRTLTPPPLERLAAIADAAVEQHRRECSPTPRPRRRWALAAGLAAAIIGTWLIVVTLLPTRRGYDAGPQVTLAQAYDRFGDEGPTWICDDDEEFIESFRSTLGQPLLLSGQPDDVVATGLSYGHCLSRATTGVLLEVRGERVVVFVDRIERDFDVPEPDHLHLFRRQVGSLVLYELTPWEQPEVLPWFSIPEQP